jgi:hypothetical protein
VSCLILIRDPRLPFTASRSPLPPSYTYYLNLRGVLFLFYFSPFSLPALFGLSPIMVQSERSSISGMGCVIPRRAPCPSSSGRSSASAAARTAGASHSRTTTTTTAACVKQQQPMQLQLRRRSSPAAALPPPIFSVSTRPLTSRRLPRESNLTKSISKLGQGNLAPRRRSTTEFVVFTSSSSTAAPPGGGRSSNSTTSSSAPAHVKKEKRAGPLHTFSFPQFWYVYNLCSTLHTTFHCFPRIG